MKTDHLSKDILQKVFKGDLVLQNVNDEPERVLLERIMGEKDVLTK
ncbi:hypothetical protein ABWH96_11405 [Marivirga tractuosa]